MYLIMWIGVIGVLVLFNKNANIIYGAVAIFIMWLGYFSVKQLHVFYQPNSFFNTERKLEREVILMW